MQRKTIINRVTNYKSFVVGKAKWVEDSEEPVLEVDMRPRTNGRPICSGCGKVRPGYDRAETPRRFEFVPLWMISVVFVDCMRRVDCPDCGVKVERVPWADGKSPMTTEYKGFLARWAKRMSWKNPNCAQRARLPQQPQRASHEIPNETQPLVVRRNGVRNGARLCARPKTGR